MLSVCMKFSAFDIIQRVINDDRNWIAKRERSNRVLEKAWQNEDQYWRSTRVSNHDNDLYFKNAMPQAKYRYTTWWIISDRDSSKMRI